METTTIVCPFCGRKVTALISNYLSDLFDEGDQKVLCSNCGNMVSTKRSPAVSFQGRRTGTSNLDATYFKRPEQYLKLATLSQTERMGRYRIDVYDFGSQLINGEIYVFAACAFEDGSDEPALSIVSIRCMLFIRTGSPISKTPSLLIFKHGADGKVEDPGLQSDEWNNIALFAAKARGLISEKLDCTNKKPWRQFWMSFWDRLFGKGKLASDRPSVNVAATPGYQQSRIELTRSLEGHEYGVSCLAISPDGRVLATGSSDTTVRLWSLPEGVLLKTVEVGENVGCLTISPDGRLLASGGGFGIMFPGKTVQLWRLPNGSLIKELGRQRDWVTCLAISPNGRLLVSGSGVSDSNARLWSLPDGVLLKTLGHRRSVNCLAISPDGRLLASGSGDKTIRLWSLPDGVLLKTLEGHQGPVTRNCLAISPDGRLLASGSGDKTVRLWSLPDGVLLNTLEGHNSTVWHLAISPNGQLLASRGDDKTVRLWGLPEGTSLKILEGDGPIAFSPDGRLLASGSDDKTIHLWGLPDGVVLTKLEGHQENVECIAISPDGRLLVSGSNDKTVRLWSLDPFRLSH